MPQILRITTWNAAMAVGKRLPHLAALEPDIAVLPEVGRQILQLVPEPRRIWKGGNTKGLAVMASPSYSVTVRSEYDDRLQWIVPVQVEGPVRFVVLAVWAMNWMTTVAPEMRPARWDVLEALDTYAQLFREQPVVVAGDFNNFVGFKRGRKAPHEEVVAKLADLGLSSAYHIKYPAEPQGEELTPTHYWRDRKEDRGRFHIDFCFLPNSWIPALSSVRVGDFATWVTAAGSDHVPVTVDLDVDRLPQSNLSTVSRGELVGPA